jgi:hypothetical protein
MPGMSKLSSATRDVYREASARVEQQSHRTRVEAITRTRPKS